MGANTNGGKQSLDPSMGMPNRWRGFGMVVLFGTSLILLALLLNTRVDVQYYRGRYDAALDTLRENNELLESYESEVQSANSRISKLNSEVSSLESENDSLKDEISSLNSKISSLSSVKLSRVDVQNNNCNNSYIFVDGRLAAGTRAGGYTYFYVPYGTYDIQVCSESSRSNCGSKSNREISLKVYPLTITKHSSCP